MKNTTRLLTVIAVLQGLMLVSQWRGASPAYGSNSLPDPGADRRETINELKSLNEKVSATNDHLVELLKYLDSGKLQVIATPADDKKGR
jgi:hypothetical protein